MSKKRASYVIVVPAVLRGRPMALFWYCVYGVVSTRILFSESSYGRLRRTVTKNTYAPGIIDFKTRPCRPRQRQPFPSSRQEYF